MSFERTINGTKPQSIKWQAYKNNINFKPTTKTEKKIMLTIC
jgi:hypothetical protein